ncbi:putative reverse transcriptase domain-containing protein [Tanacetum coccineum]
MDQKIRTLVERQAKNKKKFEYTSRNNQNQQQPSKRHNVARAYTAGPREKKPYRGSKPLCPKCNYHHDGQCAPKCTNCKRTGHLTRDCRSQPATANNQRAQGANQRILTCFECRAPGYFKSNCLKLKNNNQGNQAGNGNVVARSYVGLEVGSIRRIQGIGYGVLEFLRVETTFDIFQNIIFISYFQYGVLVFSGYGVLGSFLCGLWYGYIKNTVKNGQARTRERKSVQEPEAKVNSQSKEVKIQSTLVNKIAVLLSIVVESFDAESSGEQSARDGVVRDQIDTSNGYIWLDGEVAKGTPSERHIEDMRIEQCVNSFEE